MDTMCSEVLNSGKCLVTVMTVKDDDVLVLV